MLTAMNVRLGVAFATVFGCATDTEEPIDMTPPDTVENAQVSGTLPTNQTWRGEIEMTGETVVPAGKTLTVDPGTTFSAAEGAVLRVEGVLVIAGSSDSQVTLNPIAGAVAWGGIAVESGGSASIVHATGSAVSTLLFCKPGAAKCELDQVDFHDISRVIKVEGNATVSQSKFRNMNNGGFSVSGDGALTIVDSTIWTSSHDLIVVSGGTLTIDHSEIGGALMSDEHCDLHIGAADKVVVTNSNIISAMYGLMLGNTTGAVFQYNNFVDNMTADVLEVGDNTAADFRYNYWSGGAPTLGAAYDVSSPSATPVEAAGPR